MNQTARRNHWFGFGDCTISVIELEPPASVGKPTLLFLHGRLGHGGIWRPLIDALSGQFRCVVLDLPGYGNSFCIEDRGLSLFESAELVRQVLETQPPGPVILVGHDLGGAVAQLNAFRDAPAVEGLVLINSTGLLSGLRRLRPGLGGLAARWKIARMMRTLGRRAGESVLNGMGIELNAREAIAALEDSWPPEADWPAWRGNLSRIRQPVLLLWGGRDALNPPEAGAALYRGLREADYFQHEECGHWPFLEETDWVAAKMRDYLAKRWVRTPTEAGTRRAA